jgi:hypothetical protein
MRSLAISPEQRTPSSATAIHGGQIIQSIAEQRGQPENLFEYLDRLIIAAFPLVGIPDSCLRDNPTRNTAAAQAGGSDIPQNYTGLPRTDRHAQTRRRSLSSDSLARTDLTRCR